MMFVDVIREARDEQQVYFLLTSYVEAVRFGDQLDLIPGCVKTLPLTGIDCVRRQFQQLVAELDKASKNVHDDACVVIKEALHIFSAALDRLESLDSANGRPFPERRKRERRGYAADARARASYAAWAGESGAEAAEDHRPRAES